MKFCSLSNKCNLKLKSIKNNWELYLLLFLPLTWLLIFKYYPMYGATIAFKKYNLVRGFSESPWVGLDNFERFFKSYQAPRVIWNTLIINIYQLVFGFPFPIVFALALNYITSKVYRRVAQFISYAPHFISTVVMVGIIAQFLAPRTGIVNNFIGLFGVGDIDFMGKAEFFRLIFVGSGVWQNVGYASIIYLAALTGVDPSLHESAIIDGANKIKRMWYIDLPSISPTIIILLIMRMGRMFDLGFEKVLIMQNSLNLRVSEVIDTYSYKVGLAATLPDFSYGAAIGLAKSIISLILVSLVNKLAKSISENSLW